MGLIRIHNRIKTFWVNLWLKTRDRKCTTAVGCVEDTKPKYAKEKSAILIYEMCFLPSSGQTEGYSITSS